MKKYIPYIIIVVLLMFIASGVTYIVMNKQNDNEQNNKVQNNDANNQKEEGNDQIEKITLSDRELNMYLGYIPTGFGVDASGTNDQDAFLVTKITKDTINKNSLLAMALANYSGWNIDDGSYYVMNDTAESGLNPILKSMYNLSFSDFSVKSYDFLENNSLPVDYSYQIGGECYTYIGDKFYSVECSSGSDSILISDSYGIKDNNLIIYNYAVDAWSYDDKVEIIDLYTDKKFDVSNVSSNHEWKDAVKTYVKNNKNKFTKYKSVFKKNDTGYYWYSTEVES